MRVSDAEPKRNEADESETNYDIESVHRCSPQNCSTGQVSTEFPVGAMHLLTGADARCCVEDLKNAS